MRINKFLAQTGAVSRRQAEKLILQGRVRVNNNTITNLATQIDPGHDQTYLDGKPLTLQPKIYIMLHKPTGFVSTCKRFKGEQSVLDLVQIPERLYPIGRLDKDTAGLLLLTNDGDLALRLSHPRYEQDKEYAVETDRSIPKGVLKQSIHGVDIGDNHVELVKASQFVVTGDKSFKLVLTQGKKRQIRRMVSVLGCGVTRLTRIRIKNLTLGKLAEGKWRYLTPKEIDNLMKTESITGEHGF